MRPSLTHTTARSDVGSSTGNYIVVGDTLPRTADGAPSADLRPRLPARSTGTPLPPPSPMRKVSIYTEGTLTSPTVLSLPSTAQPSQVHPNGENSGEYALGQTGPMYASTQALRASPLVWSVVDAPLDALSSSSREPFPGTAAAPAATRATDRVIYATNPTQDVPDHRLGLADTPLNRSFGASPLPSEHGGAAHAAPQTWLQAPVPVPPARPPLPPASALPSSWSVHPDAQIERPPEAAAASPPSRPPPPRADWSPSGSLASWIGPGSLVPGSLGPLWTVRLLGAASEESAAGGRETNSPDPEAAVAALERLSLENEVRALRRHLDDAQAATEAVRREYSAKAESTVEDLLRTRREEERRRRQQFQETLDTLRDENRELTAALDAARRSTAMGLQRESRGSTVANATGAGTTHQNTLVIPATLEAEWARRLDEVESYWRERLRTAERHWTQEMDAQLSSQSREQQQLREAQRAVTALQEQLRHAEAEHAYVVEQVERRMGMPLSTILDTRSAREWAIGGSQAAALVTADREGVEPSSSSWESVPQLVEEVKTLRAAVVEHQHREEALLAQLDGYSEEAVRLQVTFDQETQKLRREIEAERGRNADLVHLYGGQVQSLHAQLKDAMRERKELVEALRTLQ